MDIVAQRTRQGRAVGGGENRRDELKHLRDLRRGDIGQQGLLARIVAEERGVADPRPACDLADGYLVERLFDKQREQCRIERPARAHLSRVSPLRHFFYLSRPAHWQTG